jgi:hypothetical protein
LDVSFVLTAPTTNNTDPSGTFSYVSDNTNVATVSGDVITIVSVGNATIRATQASTMDYNSVSIDASLVINKSNPTLSDFNTITATYGDASFTIIPPTTNNTDPSGTFSYVVNDISIASTIGNKINIRGVGNTYIRAIQAESNNFNSATIDASFIVNKLTPTLYNFNAITATYGDASFTIIDPSSNSNGGYIYESGNTNVVRVNGKRIIINGAGTTYIRAIQLDTTYYNSNFIDASFTVNKANPVLTNFNTITKIYKDASFNITDPSSNNIDPSGTFSYIIGNTNVSTVSGKTISIVSAGNTYIRAKQEETNNYNSITIDASLNVSKKNASITFNSITITYNDASFITLLPQSTNDDPSAIFNYSINNNNIVTLSGNILTIIKPGTANITVSQPETNNYNSASIDASLVINKLNHTLSNFSIPNKTYTVDISFALSNPDSSNNDPSGTFIYTSSDTTIASISGNIVSINKAGKINITATQQTTTYYNSASIDASFVINKFNPVLSNFNIPNYNYGDQWFLLNNPTSTNLDPSGTFSYSSSNKDVAVVYGNAVTIIGGGTSVITATQAETNNYNSGTITGNLIINPIMPTITFYNIVKTMNDVKFTLYATSNSPGEFTYISSHPNIATINNNIVSVNAIGNCTITVIQSATNSFTQATATRTLTILKAPPLIRIQNITATYGDSAIGLKPISASQGTYQYSSNNNDVISMFNNKATIVGIGSAVINIVQTESDNFLSGSTSMIITVNKANPTIIFKNLVKFDDDADFTLNPISNSNGTFTYSSSNQNVATVYGNNIHIVGLGTTTLTINQAEGTYYNASSMTVQLSIVTIKYPTLTNFDNLTKKYEESSFIIQPPDSDNSDGSFTYQSSNSSVATVNGNIININGIGTTTITANQSSTNKYYAGNISAILTVSKNSSFSFRYVPIMNFKTNKNTVYKVQKLGVSSSERIIFRTSELLPTGITLNKITGEIYGIPTIAFGEFICQVFSDSNHYSSYRQEIKLTCYE